MSSTIDWQQLHLQALKEIDQYKQRLDERENNFRRILGQFVSLLESKDSIPERRLQILKKVVQNKADIRLIAQLISGLKGGQRNDSPEEEFWDYNVLGVLTTLYGQIEIPIQEQPALSHLKKRCLDELTSPTEQIKAYANWLRSRLVWRSEAPNDKPELIECSRQTAYQKSPQTQEPDLEENIELSPHEVLIKLLERIPLPQELDDKVHFVKERISHDWDNCHKKRQCSNILDSVASLLGNVQLIFHDEHQQFEGFLIEMMKSLKIIEEYLSRDEEEQEAHLAAGRQLSHNLKNEVSDLTHTVGDQTGLTTLQQSIQNHLDRMNMYIEVHLLQEEKRNHSMMQRIQYLNERLRMAEQEAENLQQQMQTVQKKAFYDALTMLPNRFYLEEQLQKAVAEYQTLNTPLSLLVVDVDYFKRVNDTYGHKAGDKVLKTVATLLSSHTPSQGFIARFGGEEFVVVLPGFTYESAGKIAEILRSAVEQCEFLYRDKSVPIRISCGFAELHGDENIEEIFNRADQALYRAKNLGRNRCCGERDLDGDIPS